MSFFLWLYLAIPATTIYPPILRITSADGTQISLAWKRNPNDNSNNDPANEITAYELRYHSNDIERNSSSILVSKDQFETTITGLKPQTEYVFQVRILLINETSFPRKKSHSKI